MYFDYLTGYTKSRGEEKYQSSRDSENFYRSKGAKAFKKKKAKRKLANISKSKNRRV